MTPNTPSAFLGQPPGGAYAIPPTPPSQTQQGRAPYSLPVAPGPANNLPVLSVAYPNTLTLTKPFLAALNLRGGSRIHLVVPVQRGGDWYFDTRPKPGVGNAIPRSGRAMLRVAPLQKTHFQQSIPSRPDNIIRGNSNTLALRLHFALGAEIEGHPGYYRLQRLVVPRL